MNRRELFRALCGLVALACKEAPPLAPTSARRGAPPSNATRLGRARLARAPAEADRETLVRLLFADGPVPPTRSRVAAALAPRIAADWEAGRVELVEDWLLSETEARAAALLADRKSVV